MGTQIFLNEELNVATASLQEATEAITLSKSFKSFHDFAFEQGILNSPDDSFTLDTCSLIWRALEGIVLRGECGWRVIDL